MRRIGSILPTKKKTVASGPALTISTAPIRHKQGKVKMVSSTGYEFVRQVCLKQVTALPKDTATLQSPVPNSYGKSSGSDTSGAAFPAQDSRPAPITDQSPLQVAATVCMSIAVHQPNQLESKHAHPAWAYGTCKQLAPGTCYLVFGSNKFPSDFAGRSYHHGKDRH